MGKRGYFTLISTVLVAVSINFSGTLQSIVISPINSIQSSFYETREEFREFLNRCDKVEELKVEVERLSRLKALIPVYRERLRSCQQETSSPFKQKLHRVQPLAYIKLGDFSEVSLHYPEFRSGKIYGLIKDGKSAGIVSGEKGRAVALFQSSQKCLFGVYIGKVEAPGVIKGRRDGLMSIHFIPNWLQISVGDRVSTSGLDRIFPKGVPVGEVVSVEKSGLYQVATVEPYIKRLSFNYLLAIDIEANP